MNHRRQNLIGLGNNKGRSEYCKIFLPPITKNVPGYTRDVCFHYIHSGALHHFLTDKCGDIQFIIFYRLLRLFHSGLWPWLNNRLSY